MSNNRLPSPKSNLRTSFMPSTAKCVGIVSPSGRNTENKDPSLFTSIGAGSKSPLVKLPIEPVAEKPTTVQSPKAKVVVQTKPKPVTQPTKLATETSTKVLPPTEKKEDLRMTYAANSTASKDLIKNEGIRKSVLSPNCKPNFKLPQKQPKEHKEPVVTTQPATIAKTKVEPIGHGEVPKSPTAKLHPPTLMPKPKVQPPQQPNHQHQHHHVIGGFVVGKVVGTGRFGQVYLAKHQQTNFICALKKLNKAKVRQANSLQQIIDQIKLLSLLNNPNIVQFYGCITDAENVYLILEFLEGGTLQNRINTSKKLSQIDTVLIIRELGIALKELQDMNIIHRQMKCENIVLCYGIAKLCGFGWAHRTKKNAPNNGNHSNNSTNSSIIHEEHNQTFDLWCLGMLTYELLTGKQPFDAKHKWLNMQETVPSETMQVDVNKIDYPADMSKHAIEFIQGLLKKHPQEQLRPDKMLVHTFLTRPEVNRPAKQP